MESVMWGRSAAGSAAGAAAFALALALTSCAPAPATSSAAPSTVTSPTATARGTATAAPGGWWRREGEPRTLADGLRSPWSVVPLTGGGALISQRDDGAIIEVTPAGTTRQVGRVPGVVADGEAGLNGIALRHADGATWLYAYHAAADDNRVVRMPLEGTPGSFRLGQSEAVFTGIPKASIHNGGRIAFGPDGFLYVTTGDATRTGQAQDTDSLSGKILRLTPDGDPAPGNPFGNAVYSYGHRNVQGIAWTADGTMWASEFGQDTWDELNVIVSGGNYGWPRVEGMGDDSTYRNPLAQWPTREASPSGLAAVGDTLFLASLRGERLWRVDTRDATVVGEPKVALDGLGRLRDAVHAPDGSLWVLTDNTDGRGRPRPGDDRLLRLPLAAAQ